MADTYTTREGDQWDSIAKTVYGNERYAAWLMKNNVMLVDIYQFDHGVTLLTPDLPEDESDTLPPWRREADA